MTNRHTTFLHGDYLDGDLAPDEKARVEEHLKTCQSCRDDLDRLKRLTATLGAIETSDPGDDYFDNLLDTIVARSEATVSESRPQASPPAGGLGTRRILKTLIRLAAAITLLFTALYISDFSQSQRSTGRSNRFTQGNYVDVESESIDPADYLPAGIITGIPYSVDTVDMTIEESQEEDAQEEF